MKKYILDTNVLLDDDLSIERLLAEGETKIYIPETVIEELDGLKKDNKLCYRVSKVVNQLNIHKDEITIIKNHSKHESNDNKILNEISKSSDELDGAEFITNDNLLRFKADKLGLNPQPYKYSGLTLSEAQLYTGFVNRDEGEDLVKNCFYWKDGKLHFNNRYGEEIPIDYDNDPWKIKPKSPYQNAALDLMLNDEIDIITVQSAAGHGKTYLAIASALKLMCEDKKFKKIYVCKSNVEIGQKMGFLPGDISDKVAPYFRPILDLLKKLHNIRPIRKVWNSVGIEKDETMELNPKYIEFLPINFVRGMNIDNAIIIIDECQNLTRLETRTILSRMGENCKCFLLGDVNQIDNPNLSKDDNGLNWVLKKFKGEVNYGHIVLSGKKSRGPIADLVNNLGL